MMSLRTRCTVLALATIGLGTIASVPAHAQSNCNSIGNVVNAVWDKFGERIKAKGCKDTAECMANAQKKEEIIKEMVAFWNQQAQGSWATIGPRPLVLGGGWNDGKVVLGTSRMFVSQVKVTGNTTELKITKQGGGGAKISLAYFDGSACSQGTSVDFEKGDKDGAVKTLKLTGTKDKVVFVKVDADGSQSFDYKFTAVAN